MKYICPACGLKIRNSKNGNATKEQIERHEEGYHHKKRMETIAKQEALKARRGY